MVLKAVAVVAVAALLVATIWVSTGSEEVGRGRAVIVDGLSKEFPNEELIAKVKSYLESSGFEVEVIPADNVTVETYRKVLEGGYRVLIFRIHGGYCSEGKEVYVGLFANEAFNESGYVSERYLGLVGSGIPFANPEKVVFVISSRFVELYGSGLKGSLVMVFSCFSLYGESMAKAFIDRGSAAYVGWGGGVDPVTNDYALERLTYYFFVEGLTLSQSISHTMIDVMGKYRVRHILALYPEEASTLRAGDLK